MYMDFYLIVVWRVNNGGVELCMAKVPRKGNCAAVIKPIEKATNCFANTLASFIIRTSHMK